MKARTFEGLEQIAAVCMSTPDEILNWHRTSDFPLTRKGSRWSSSVDDIEKWARDRREAERRRP